MSNAFDKASLVMLPHAYEEGKLYSLKPTDRSGDFTFSRGTDTATRVNEQGYIEKETVNLLLQSNSFSDAAWTKNTTSVTSGQSGYDGTNDAWLLNSTGTGFPRIQQSISTSGVFVFSVYAKPATDGFMLIRTFGADAQVWFDLSDGSISTETGGQYISSTTEDVGNGWYRYSVLVNGSLTSVRIYPASAYGVYSPSGNGIYIQDAMINPGLVAQPYLETTTVPVYGGLTDNMPRLDYTDASCPSLLLEPSRTNLLKYSEWMGGLEVAYASIDIDDTISPEGYANVSKITSLSGSTKIVNSSISYVAGTTYTFSAWVKNIDASVVQFLWYDGSSNRVYKTDEVNTETFTRIQFSFAPNTTNSNGQFQIARDLPTGESFYIYGAQLEVGSYPTSYIPTYGSAQTRAQDDLAQLDVTGLTSTYNTLYAEFEVSNITNQGKIALSDNSQNNRMSIYQSGDDLMLLLNAGGSAQTQIIASNILAVGTNYKVVVKNQNGSHALFINGTKIGEENSTAPTGLSKLRFGNEVNSISTQKFLGEVKQTLLFTTALSDAECIALTQN